MTARENEEIGRRLVEAWNTHDPAVLDEIFSPDYIGHWYDIGGGDVNRAGAKEFMRNVFEGFPDYRMEIEYIHADDEMVTFGFTSQGTHEQAFYGIQPTGVEPVVERPTPGIVSMRVEDGQVVEGWSTWDALGLLQELGVLPRDVGEAASAD